MYNSADFVLCPFVLCCALLPPSLCTSLRISTRKTTTTTFLSGTTARRSLQSIFLQLVEYGINGMPWLSKCRHAAGNISCCQEGTEESLRQSRQRLQRWGAQEGNVVACCSLGKWPSKSMAVMRGTFFAQEIMWISMAILVAHEVMKL